MKNEMAIQLGNLKSRVELVLNSALTTHKNTKLKSVIKIASESIAGAVTVNLPVTLITTALFRSCKPQDLLIAGVREVLASGTAYFIRNYFRDEKLLKEKHKVADINICAGAVGGALKYWINVGGFIGVITGAVNNACYESSRPKIIANHNNVIGLVNIICKLEGLIDGVGKGFLSSFAGYSTFSTIPSSTAANIFAGGLVAGFIRNTGSLSGYLQEKMVSFAESVLISQAQPEQVRQSERYL